MIQQCQVPVLRAIDASSLPMVGQRLPAAQISLGRCHGQCSSEKLPPNSKLLSRLVLKNRFAYRRRDGPGEHARKTLFHFGADNLTHIRDSLGSYHLTESSYNTNTPRHS